MIMKFRVKTWKIKFYKKKGFKFASYNKRLFSL